MELIYEFTAHADLLEPLPVGTTPRGDRVIVGVTGGWVRGERLNGEFVPPGGDWLTIGADGYGRLDVRAQIRTDDGAVIYTYYEGVLDLARMMSGAGDSFDAGYFRITPRYQTSDERYAWMNHTIFVGRGRLLPNAVEYEISRVS